MYTSTHIRRYIFNLPHDAIFASREFLRFGKRAAVDQCLSRLVRRGIIIRLTRGLFKRFEFGSLPSSFIVASHKAQAFAKRITHSTASEAQSYLQAPGQLSANYAVNNHSTQFRYQETIIRLKGISSRKMCLPDNSVGLAIRALWDLGKNGCNDKSIANAMANFDKYDRRQFRQLATRMPGWLADRIFRF